MKTPFLSLSGAFCLLAFHTPIELSGYKTQLRQPGRSFQPKEAAADKTARDAEGCRILAGAPDPMLDPFFCCRWLPMYATQRSDALRAAPRHASLTRCGRRPGASAGIVSSAWDAAKLADRGRTGRLSGRYSPGEAKNRRRLCGNDAFRESARESVTVGAKPWTGPSAKNCWAKFQGTRKNQEATAPRTPETPSATDEAVGQTAWAGAAN